MQSLAAILQSYQSLNVKDAAIEFRITILSKDHIQKLKDKLKKQKTLPKNILRANSDDEMDLVGTNETNSKRKKKTAYQSISLKLCRASQQEN